MSIIVNLYYTGQNGNARKFAEEMTSRGIVDAETDCGTSEKNKLHLRAE